MTGNPVGLVEFLLQRLDDEQRPTFELVPYECEPGCCAPAGWVGHRCLICETTSFGGTVEAITEICREHEESIHRRSYVLRDIAAKRRIIEEGGSMCGGYYPPGSQDRLADEQGAAERGMEFQPHWPKDYHPFCDGCAAAQSADSERFRVLRLLAAPFSSHPDWKPEWNTE